MGPLREVESVKILEPYKAWPKSVGSWNIGGLTVNENKFPDAKQVHLQLK